MASRTPPAHDLVGVLLPGSTGSFTSLVTTHHCPDVSPMPGPAVFTLDG